ncbi:hypothetical protein A3759_28020 [Thalassolituus sp. HI0120]|nr:hypothetical protein A3759_15570 [Thalassolituus sp. HI0120]KZZ48334.1 hypothetical protein A3759_28020 [Thalassolituus sp. HI0120]
MDHLPELSADCLNGTLQQHQLVLLDFWAPSCAPCLAMLPLLQSVQQRQPQVYIAKVNAEDHTALAEGYQIRSLPTLILLQEGEVVGRLQGVCGESQIMALLQPWLDDDIDTRLQSLEQKRLTGSYLSSDDLAFLERTVHAKPENSRARGLLIHALLDQLKAEFPQPEEALAPIAALLQVEHFEWLRGPQIQQAQQRFGYMAGSYAEGVDSEVSALLLDENYHLAAETLLHQLEQQQTSAPEAVKRQFLQLIDTIADRAAAQQLRRRFFSWLHSQD